MSQGKAYRCRAPAGNNHTQSSITQPITFMTIGKKCAGELGARFDRACETGRGGTGHTPNLAYINTQIIMVSVKPHNKSPPNDVTQFFRKRTLFLSIQ